MKAGDIARRVSFVAPDTLAGEIDTFPVVRNGRPIGVITRARLEALRKHGGLWERRPAALFMNPQPIIIREDCELADVSALVAPLSRDALFEGIVMVDAAGDYTGLAGAFELFRAAIAVSDQRNHELSQLADRLAAETDKANAASRAKSEFLATMSHEIRTPLNGVLGMAQALGADELTSDQRDKLTTILDCGETLTVLLNDILDHSKIEAGKMEIAPVDTDLRLVLQRAVSLSAPRAREKGIDLLLERDAPGPDWFCLDRVRVQQCITNLISNAIKFTSAGAVTVRYGAQASDCDAHIIRVSVQDTGIGMDAATQLRLFNAFTQADGSTTRRFGGTGLGLAITRRLARMMGGDIQIVSEPGRGSTFVATFAATAVAPRRIAAPQAATDAAPPVTGVTLRILLVDDNVINRQVARLFLAGLRADIVEAANGAEALEKLAGRAFDLVLLDVHMPVMDGCETIRRIRASHEAWRALPVIALTADAMEGDRERFVGMGMTDYLPKPIDRRALLNAIHAATARAPALSPPATAPEATGDDADLSDVFDIITAASAA
jgi:signal transduction histidine kinase/ActR/RegA family two-component response regulator